MKRLAPIVIVLAALAVLVVYWITHAREGSVTGGGTLRVSGMVEATTVDVGPEVPCTVLRLLVDEGDTVRAGGCSARRCLWPLRRCGKTWLSLTGTSYYR